jgi:hypothetical protein
MKTQKPIPPSFYYEYIREQKEAILKTKKMVDLQQKRIAAVKASGLDFEIMKGGNGKTWEIPLTKLEKFKHEAEENLKKVPKMEEDLQKFINKHKPVNGLKGNLEAAIIEANYIKLLRPHFFDSKYNFYHKLIWKHFLTNAQSEKLMEVFVKLNIV